MKRAVIALFKSIDEARSTKIMMEQINIKDKDVYIILKEDPEEELKRLLDYGFTKEELESIDMGFKNADNLLAVRPVENYQEVNKFLVVNGASSTFIAPEIKTHDQENNYKVDIQDSIINTQNINVKNDLSNSIELKDKTNFENTITLTEEKLNINKEQLNSEVVLRTEVIEEIKTIQVPVYKEVVVVEKVDPNSNVEEIMRIPVAEEKVEINKSTIINEEVNVKKVQITENKLFDESLKKEQIKVAKVSQNNI